MVQSVRTEEALMMTRGVAKARNAYKICNKDLMCILTMVMMRLMAGLTIIVVVGIKDSD